MRGDKASVRDTGRVKAGKVVCSTGPTAGHNPKLRESDRGDPGIIPFTTAGSWGTWLKKGHQVTLPDFTYSRARQPKWWTGLLKRAGCPFSLPQSKAEREREREREKQRKRDTANRKKNGKREVCMTSSSPCSQQCWQNQQPQE